MSSDSSEDENIAQLREALDPSLISDIMYKEIDQKNKSDSRKLKIEENAIKIPSIRETLSSNPKEEFNQLGVTPEFQKYVGNQLEKIIDQSIDFNRKEKAMKRSKNKQHSDEPEGIQLFKSSQVILTKNDPEFEDYVQEKPKASSKVKRPKTIHSEYSTVEESEKIIQSAVSPDYILSKEEIKNWSKRTKRKPFIYKTNKNGTLELVEPKYEKL